MRHDAKENSVAMHCKLEFLSPIYVAKVEAFMKLHIFIERTGVRQAFTLCKEGDDLPEGWWEYAGITDLKEDRGVNSGATSSEMLAAIQRDGVFLSNSINNAS